MSKYWFLTLTIMALLTACSESGTPTDPPQATTIDSFGAAPNPVPSNVAALFSWTVYGSNLVCKLDVEGDGTVDYTVTNCTSQSRVAHVYGEVGSFKARLTATGSDGKTQTRTTDVTTSGPNTPPSIPEFKSGVPATTTNPLAVNFNWVVADRDSDVTYCRFDAESDGKWEFSGLCSGLAATSGEVKGASSTGFSLIHPYTKPGRYEATLEAADPYEVVSSKVKVRAPWNRAPQIDNFKTTATGGTAGQVVFKVSDPDDDSLECILKVQSIGTFRYNNCHQLTRNFTFPDSGTFTISLEVTDTYGAVSRRSTTLSFVPPPPPPKIIALSGGLAQETTCAVAEDGRAYCWGLNDNGQAGQDPSIEYVTTPKQIGGSPSGSKWVQIASGGYQTCGIRDDGTAWCWGNNESGQLGNNSLVNSHLPVLVAGGHTFSQITAGNYFSCGLRTDNKAYCWGWNQLGQVGDGSTYSDKQVPTAVAGNNSFSSIASGRNHTCGILQSTGAMKCWGSADQGTLGNNVKGSQAKSNTPVDLDMSNSPGGLSWTVLGSGLHDATCAIRSTGEAYCWGQGNSGVLGNGYLPNPPLDSIVARPDQPVGTSGVSGTAWTRMDVGQNHACGLRDDGTAWCWGAQAVGVLGNGVDNNDWTGGANVTAGPVAVDVSNLTGTKFVDLVVATQHSCGLRDDNSLWCWGYNGDGILGVATAASVSAVPVRVIFP